jgi:hypothetical protein
VACKNCSISKDASVIKTACAYNLMHTHFRKCTVCKTICLQSALQQCHNARTLRQLYSDAHIFLTPSCCPYNVLTHQQDAQKIDQLNNDNLKLQSEVEGLYNAKETLTSANKELTAQIGKLDIMNKHLDCTMFNMEVATLATTGVIMYDKKMSDAISAILIAHLLDEKSAVIKDNEVLTDKVSLLTDKVSELTAQNDILIDDKAVLI